MNTSNHDMVKAELDDLISKFFGAVSFEIGSMHAFEGIPALFIERGLLIKMWARHPRSRRLMNSSSLAKRWCSPAR